MTFIIIILGTLILGVIVGALLYRNNAQKIQKTEDSGKKLLDALKGR